MMDATQSDSAGRPGQGVLLEEACYRRTLLGRLDGRVFEGRAGRAVCVVLLGVILAVPAVQSVHYIQQVDKSLFRSGGERHGTALGRWLPTAALLTDDDNDANPYGLGHWFPTPPFVLMTLVPLSGMGYTAAGIVWAVLKIAGFLWVMAMLVRELRRDGFVVPVGVLVMAGVFSLRPIVSDLQHGNLNTFMMIWLAWAWVLYMRGRDFWAGMLVGLAIVTKITPALLLVYFLYRRAWRVCAGAAVGLGLFFIVLPGLYLGFWHNIELLGAWFDMLVAPFALHGYATLDIPNQSLYGVALRLLSNAGLLTIEQMPADQALAAGMECMARPATFAGRLLRPALSLGAVGVLAWLCRPRDRDRPRHDPLLLMEFALILLGMLLLSERTWKHHGTTLPIVYLGVWTVLTCVDWSPRFRAWFVAGLIVQLALLVGSSEGVVGERLSELLLDGGVFCWGLLLCFLQVGILHQRLARRTCPPLGHLHDEMANIPMR